MSFINTETGEMHFFETPIISPRYAILSSGWEYEKFSFDAIRNPTHGLPGPGLANLDRARAVAQSRGIQWLWAAGECVNCSDQRQLNYSINCSSQLFQRSEVCLVYLYDLDLDEEPRDGWHAALQKCQWMHRAWTRHEIIFSKRIEFYNRNWLSIGTKDTLLSSLSKITRVDPSVLEHPSRLDDFSVGHKMSWIASSMVAHVEDLAYSLIGIFGVVLQICYGEGEMAFFKLQAQIAKTTNDGTLFAWQNNGFEKYRRVFAKSPSEFSFMSYSHKAPLRIRGNISFTEDGLSITDRFHPCNDGEGIILTMWPDQNKHGGQGLGIILSERNGQYMRCMPHRTLDVIHMPTSPVKEIIIGGGIQPGIETLTEPQPCSQELHYPGGFISSYQFHLKQQNEPQDSSSTAEECLSEPNPEPNFDLETKPLALRPYPNNYDTDDTDTIGTCTEYANPALDANNTLLISTESHSILSHQEESDGVKCETWISTERPNRIQDNEAPAFVKKLKEVGLKAFFSWIPEVQSLGKRGREDTTLSYTSLPFRKRQRVELSPQELSIEYVTDSDDEDTTIIQTHCFPKKFFACPLYAENEDGNLSCLKTVNLSTIDDVINHLLSAHRRPYYCPICGDIFPNCTERDNHIIARTCRQGPLPDTDGISEYQIRQACYDFTSLQTKEVQWYMIWDSLFPDQKQPEQPYLSGDVEHTVCMLRDFWSRKGKDIVSKHLDPADVTHLPAANNDLQHICATVLIHMVEDLLDGATT